VFEAGGLHWLEPPGVGDVPSDALQVVVPAAFDLMALVPDAD